MNKLKIVSVLCGLAVLGMIGQWIYYETQAEAGTTAINQKILENSYTLSYKTTVERDAILLEEEKKRCFQIDDTAGVLTISCLQGLKEEIQLEDHENRLQIIETQLGLR